MQLRSWGSFAAAARSIWKCGKVGGQSGSSGVSCSSSCNEYLSNDRRGEKNAFWFTSHPGDHWTVEADDSGGTFARLRDPAAHPVAPVPARLTPGKTSLPTIADQSDRYRPARHPHPPRVTIPLIWSKPVKVYEGKDIRNVGVVGHGDSGKTTLTAGLLFTAGATNRLLRVDEGNTITDFDDEEIARKITISTAIAVAEWKKTKINILDTPGYNIFINDTRAAARRGRCRAGASGWRGRRRSADRKGLELRQRIQASARHRNQRARPRARRFPAGPR